jgi:hypothetical protein
LYEFCIAVGLKQRRCTEAHCTWVGGVPFAEMNAKSLTAGRKITAAGTAWGDAPTPMNTVVKIPTAAIATRRMTERADVRAMFSPLPSRSGPQYWSITGPKRNRPRV